jgi:hypothetical protein
MFFPRIHSRSPHCESGAVESPVFCRKRKSLSNSNLLSCMACQPLEVPRLGRQPARLPCRSCGASGSEFLCAGRSTDFVCRSLLMGCCRLRPIAATFGVACKATSNELLITYFACCAKESFEMLALTQRTFEDDLKAAFPQSDQVHESNRFRGTTRFRGFRTACAIRRDGRG